MVYIYDMLSLEILLPFFLVLAIVYGSLEVSHVFHNRAVKAIISMVFAFFAVSNSEIVSLINYWLPYAAIFFIALFLFQFVKKPVSSVTQGDPTLAVILVGLAALFLARLYAMEEVPYFLEDPSVVWLLGLVVVIFMILKAYKMG